MKSEVQRILGEHRVLDQAAAELETVIMAGRRHARDAFVSLSSFASSLSEHLLNEAASFYEARIAPRPNEACFDAELVELRADWDEYLCTWSESSARDDWDRFSTQSLAILQRVRARIHRENDMILR